MTQSPDQADRLNELLIKVVMVGDSSVGKTALLRRFTYQTDKEDLRATIGVDFELLDRVINGYTARIQVWDTAGQERFRSIARTHYRGAHVIMIVYDITDENSFKNVQYWKDEIDKQTSDNSYILLIVGNKKDLENERKVDYSEGRTLADTLECEFIETSAKEGINVNDAFDSVLQKVVALKGEHLVRKSRVEARDGEGEMGGCC